jgi:hypothetical protein
MLHPNPDVAAGVVIPEVDSEMSDLSANSFQLYQIEKDHEYRN